MTKELMRFLPWYAYARWFVRSISIQCSPFATEEGSEILGIEAFSGIGGCVSVGIWVGVEVGGKVGVLVGRAVGEAVNVRVGEGVKVGLGVNVALGVNVGLGVEEALLSLDGSIEIIFNAEVANEMLGVPNQRKRLIETKIRTRNHGIIAVRCLVSDPIEILLGTSCRWYWGCGFDVLYRFMAQCIPFLARWLSGLMVNALLR